MTLRTTFHHWTLGSVTERWGEVASDLICIPQKPSWRSLYFYTANVAANRFLQSDLKNFSHHHRASVGSKILLKLKYP